MEKKAVEYNPLQPQPPVFPRGKIKRLGLGKMAPKEWWSVLHIRNALFWVGFTPLWYLFFVLRLVLSANKAKLKNSKIDEVLENWKIIKPMF